MTCCLAALASVNGFAAQTDVTSPSGTKATPEAKSQAVQQQKKQIKGRVIDANGDPIIGATVTQAGTDNRTITDVDGNFTLNAPTGSTLKITYVGFDAQEVAATPGVEVTLQESANLLNEVVTVGYGVQKIGTVTGSVAQVKSEKLTVAPIGNITNTLGGQLPGLVSKQESGLPGEDSASLNIRNFGSPLVIVDGVESSLFALDPSQIESVSILKDGAASIYGARAGNGVILVTTKRGTAGQVKVNANVSFSWQGSTNTIKPASSAQRAWYRRESWINSGENPDNAPYTEEEIELFRNGTDPNYLNTDWWGATLKSLAPMQNHNVSITGGTDKLRYYGYMGYTRQSTMLKKNGGHFDHLNFMANMDAKLLPRLTASFDIKYTHWQRLYPAACDSPATNNNFWRDLVYNADPQYPLSLPDPTKLAYAGISYGSPVFGTNSKLAGKTNTKSNITIVRGSLKYDFKYVPGLYAKGDVTYTHTQEGGKTFKQQQPFYTYNSESDEYTLVRRSQDPNSMSMSNSNTNRTNLQLSLNYDHTFGGHTIGAQFIYEYDLLRNQGFSGSEQGFNSYILQEFFAGDPETAGLSSWSSNYGRLSYIGRINYNYKDRYLVEGILRADASSRYEKGSRWGYFPSISVGWNVANEPFMKTVRPLDLLKIRFSYGKSGDDSVGNFAYLSGYAYDDSYTFGNTLYQGLISTGLPNPDLTWEKMSITNFGIDYGLWGRKLYGSFDVFHRHRSGIPGQRSASMPSTFGANLPTENLNSINTNGFEFSVGTANKLADFTYDVSGNISYSRAKWDKYDQAAYTDPDEDRLYRNAGHYTDRMTGYVFDGLFTSQEEIDNWNCTYDALNNDNSTLRPGDAKYKDLNGDGVINWRDQKDIGKGYTPHWMYGLSFNLTYKGFDLQGLLQGAFDYSTYVVLDQNYSSLCYKYAWTEENNNPRAYVPRIGGNSTVNWFWSTYRIHDTSYLRLRNIALGYTIPRNITQKWGVERLRVYVAGTNLFTISNLNKYGVDPEMSSSYDAGIGYPQQYTFSFGLNLTF